MLELQIPSTFSVEQSTVVGESVGARGATDVQLRLLIGKYPLPCVIKTNRRVGAHVDNAQA